MAKITLEVPDDVAEMFKALEFRLKSLEADKTGAAPAVKESEVDVVTSGIALELKRRGLQALEIDTEYILVDGKRHKRVLKTEATYYAKEGTVRVTRSLFRECGVRNARTVDPVAARMGTVGTWLPEVAKAAAFLGSLGAALAIDGFGLLGATAIPVTATRVAGIVLAVVGFLLARR